MNIKNNDLGTEGLADAMPTPSEVNAKETKAILVAKHEARNEGQLSGPFTTAESLINHLRQAKP